MRPSESLATVYQRMKLYDVSQMPVMDGDVIVGIIDESDVLMKVFENSDAFEDSVESAMTSNLEFLDVKTPLEKLMPIFDDGKVAIVKDNSQFLGLITRIDLLNYLRRVDTNQ